jgi:hypothetical protein
VAVGSGIRFTVRLMRVCVGTALALAAYAGRQIFQPHSIARLIGTEALLC